MVKRAGTAGAMLLTTVALASCGGGDDDGTGYVAPSEKGAINGTPTSKQVVECLKTKGKETGFAVSESPADLDTVARRATDRAVALEGGGKRALVIMERTEPEARSIRDQYDEGPDSENGGSFYQTGTIVLVGKVSFFDGKQGDAINDCTKYGTKQ
jgi:hypothetical protein